MGGFHEKEAEHMVHVDKPLLPNIVRYHPPIFTRPLT